MERNKKKANKNPKTKKKQPLKVVYITNPIKFNTSASEFRALVQELTGQDADTDAAYSSASFSGGGEAAKVAAEDNAHADQLEQEVAKLGQPNGGADVYGLSSAAEAFDDGFVSSLMMESFSEWPQNQT